MKISEVCKLTEMNKRTIHFYIEEQLITPITNKDNGYYDFSEEDVKKLLFVKDLRNTGISIPEIRSLLHNPLTANHYLNFHIQKLKKEKEFIEKNISSMKYMLDHLSLRPDFNELYELEKKAKIPTPSSIISTEFDSYMASLLTNYLWGPFFSEKKLNDYQEFMVNKMNNEILENQSEEYKTLLQFFKTLSPKTIETLYETNQTRYDYIVSLKDEDLDSYAKELITVLHKVIDNTYLQNIWKKYYNEYFKPSTTIYASAYSRYIYEVNDYFKNYSINVRRLLDYVYNYLSSKEGKDLNDKLHKALNGYLNLEANNHGDLECLYNLEFCAAALTK
ncbi:MAG: MerR family transcriptional regulator [Erysipelotrichaceae bacterium]|nr:MerR family transcriptional regulator [Erysipelotrichaceae bacterium]